LVSFTSNRTPVTYPGDGSRRRGHEPIHLVENTGIDPVTSEPIFAVAEAFFVLRVAENVQSIITSN